MGQSSRSSLATSGHITVAFAPGRSMSDDEAVDALGRLGAGAPIGRSSDGAARWAACGLKDDGSIALFKAAGSPECPGISLDERYTRAGISCAEA